MSRALPGRLRLLAVLTILFTSALGTGVASAVRSPSGGEAGGMQAALLDDCALHQTNCVWHGGLVSSVDDEFAFGSAAGDTSEYDAILFRNDASSASWVVLDVLQPDTACDQLQTMVPAQVLDDLAIKGVKSASTPVLCGTPAAKPKVCSSVRTSTTKVDVSVLRISCTKARSLVKAGLKRQSHAPSGWSWIDPTACSSFIVAHKNRGVQYPLVELTKGQPVIFVDQAATTSTTAGADGGSACGDAAPAA